MPERLSMINEKKCDGGQTFRDFRRAVFFLGFSSVFDNPKKEEILLPSPFPLAPLAFLLLEWYLSAT